MLAQLRCTAHVAARSSPPCIAHLRTRTLITSTQTRRAGPFNPAGASNAAEDVAEEGFSGDQPVEETQRGRRSRSNATWDQWLATDGLKFKGHERSCNWLGGEVPFPNNPSFKPPAPVSDEVKSEIWRAFMSDPKTNSVRTLASHYHLSIKRVDAILRLKGVEEHFKKEDKELQTGFLRGMEHILGVHRPRTQPIRNRPNEASERHDIDEADAQDEMAGNDAARQRYQRMFWEPVPEGKEPIMPGILEVASQEAAARKKAQEEAKSNPRLTPEYHSKVNERVKIVHAAGRPPLKFVDVGGKFLDLKSIARREQESERRSKIRAKKRQESEQVEAFP